MLFLFKTTVSNVIPNAFRGIEHLATAIVLADEALTLRYANPAAENLFKVSAKHLVGLPLSRIFVDADPLLAAVQLALTDGASYSEHELSLAMSRDHVVQISCAITPVDVEGIAVILEIQHIDQQLRIAREERMQLQQQANRELLRNLAHEIKNPLGGIRGAAQLLEAELPLPALREYTQVMIKETDRLQSLMDRMLTPHRLTRFESLNIHAVLERVRSVVLAETPNVRIRRDYDTSLPELVGDEEQLIQVMLNIVRNGVQAMQGDGTVTLRTRIARHITLARKRRPLAIVVQIIDSGPGVPEALLETVFYPLVSGREGGTGLGLTIAQAFVNQHDGMIECQNLAQGACFTVLLPLEARRAQPRVVD